MSDLVTALGLVFVIEGLLYAFVPGHLKAVMALMQSIPEDGSESLWSGLPGRV